MSVSLLLLILAFVSFVLGAVGVPSRVSWIALGLALWVLTLILRI